ncbi:hypothetical protein DJ93_3937 [Bacillus clarus]|uniref:Uncharacterized protein n=1 Tax=Bacillus clarus TaxID=2338372 RepID=A0A090Z068_9BACI|nr:hypothetical protein DJ93_3937 [Bacillus clarus]
MKPIIKQRYYTNINKKTEIYYVFIDLQKGKRG